MQTFLPYSDFYKTAECLDYKRLGKQRLETLQIYKSLTEKNYGWKNHPAVKMWKGYEKELLIYGIIICNEWIKRGYKDTLKERFIKELFKYQFYFYIDYNGNFELAKEKIKYPIWLNEEFCKSHQSNLIRKFPEYYKKYFPNVPDNLSYIWPTKL